MQLRSASVRYPYNGTSFRTFSVLLICYYWRTSCQITTTHGYNDEKKISLPETMHTKSMVESSFISRNLPTFLEDKHYKKIEVGGNEVDEAKKGTVQIALLLKCA